MEKYTDLYLDKFDNKDYYDISIENGDGKKVYGLQTSIVISVLSNQRASEIEIQESSNRGGWWGNLFHDYENGSKVWLLYQSSINNETKNLLNEYLKKCLSWLIDDGFVSKIDIIIKQVNNNFIFNIKTSGHAEEYSREFDLLEATLG